MSTHQHPTDGVSRRDFIKTSALATPGLSAGLIASGDYAFAAGSDTIRVGLVGCGGRGTGAARDAVVSADGVEIVAMGDLFENRLDQSRAALAEEIGDKLKVTDETCFIGFASVRRLRFCWWSSFWTLR